MTNKCWGVYGHDLNNGKGQKYFWEIWFLQYDLKDECGVKGYIDPMDPDNPYGALNSQLPIDLKYGLTDRTGTTNDTER
jgi:hypothetical protein